MFKVILIVTNILFFSYGYFIAKKGSDLDYTLKMMEYLDKKIEEHDFSNVW